MGTRYDLNASKSLSCVLSICPGRHLALNSLTLFVASVLHVYDIKPHIGENGEPLSKSVKATSGVLSYVFIFYCCEVIPVMSNGVIIRYPELVPCTLVPRSEQSKRLILEETL